MPRVPGYGPSNARIVIVGEAPGRAEEREQRPFVGSSGKLLDQMLASAGIARNACYITNVIKQHPPGGNFSVLYEDDKYRVPSQELVQARAELLEEIRAINPVVVIALGAEALRALLNKSGISKWRGSVLRLDEKDPESPKVVPTFHPSYIMKVYGDRPIAELDLRKACKESTTRELTETKHVFEVDPNYECVLERLSKIKATKPRIAFDIETCYDGRSFSSLVRCLGIAWSRHEAICIPFTADANRTRAGDTVVQLATGTGVNNSRWTEEQERTILEKLNEIFLDEGIEKVAQNFQFDATYLAKDFGFEIKNLHMDTMLVAHCCYPEFPKSLDFLTSMYTHNNYYADYSPASDLSTWFYNCMDCVSTFEVAEKLEAEAVEAKVWNFYKEYVEPAMFALTRAQNRGVFVDERFMKEFANDKAAKAEVLLSKIEGIVGQPLNPKSPKQMKDYFYGDLKLQPVIDRASNKPSLGEPALYTLSKKYPQHAKLFDHCLKYRQLSHTVSFIEKLELTNGKLCTSYNIAGTVNGRLSSSATLFGEGTNMQNITRGEIRKMVVAPPGHFLIKVDLSQAEVRFVVWDSKNEYLIEKFQDPEFDIHTWHAASNVYLTEESNVTKPMRSIAKAGVHGGNYGMGPRQAAAIYQIPYQDAKQSIDAYRLAMSPHLQEWWRDIEEQVNSTRVLYSPLGRRRMFFGRLDDSLYRSAYSFKPQAVVVDIINKAFAYGEEALAKEKAYPAIQVHDEIVWVCPINTIETAMPKILKLMQPSIDMGTKIPLVIPAEASYGPNWHDQTDWEVK